MLNCLYAYESGGNWDIVQKKAVTNSEKLSDYYIKMAKKNKLETIEESEIRKSIKNSGKISAQDQFIAAYTQNPNLNRSKLAENLNVSRVTINKWIKQIECKPTVN